MPAMVLADAMAAPLVLVCLVVTACPSVLRGGDSAFAQRQEKV